MEKCLKNTHRILYHIKNNNMLNASSILTMHLNCVHSHTQTLHYLYSTLKLLYLLFHNERMQNLFPNSIHPAFYFSVPMN